MATETPAPFRLACVQVNAGSDMDVNIERAAALARDARAGGAEFIAFPECVSFMAPDGDGVREAAAPEDTHKALSAFRALAPELSCWLLIGSLATEGVEGPNGRVANRSFLIADDGEIRARYDKIHMFDVDLKSGESYRESNTYAPGDEAVLAATPFGRLGLTICYDLRFPYLYRTLAKAGAEMIAVPSAFTRTTGEAHWHTLLRARAIETGCFVLAPAQCGTHAKGRETFGHSLIINPWGDVIAEAGTEPGVIAATVDLTEVARARAMVPSLDHDRDFAPPGKP